MISIKVLFFATLRDYVGEKSIELEMSSGATISDLIQKLMDLFPALEKVKDTLIVAVNREYTPITQVIPDGCEIALFPPVSGG